MKYLLVVLVVGVALFMWTARSRGRRAPPPAPGPAGKPAAPPAPAPMLACAHCGVHLPAAEASRDDSGRGYCSAAHRLAGPR